MRKPVALSYNAPDEDWTVLYDYQNITGVPEMLQEYERQEMHLQTTCDPVETEERQLVRDLEFLFPLLVVGACREIEKSRPSYLQLPRVLSSIAQEGSLYVFARSYGRLCFRMDQYALNEDGDLVRVPHLATRQALHDFIDSTIRLADKHLSVAIPLVFRVGLVVGWLSALSVSQPDDAQAGMVLLTALVVPLLVPQHPAQPVTEKKSRKRTHGVQSKRNKKL